LFSSKLGPVKGQANRSTLHLEKSKFICLKGTRMSVIFQRWLVAAMLAAGLTIPTTPSMAGESISQQEEQLTEDQQQDQDQDQQQDQDQDQDQDQEQDDPRQKPKPVSAGFEFEEPFRVEADGQPIAVESPGYAAPTMVDLDGDGVPDLVVGQFREGNLQFFRNLASKTETPRFAAGEWLMTEDQRAVVPGVW
jgi:hypothetical protein